MFNSEQNSNLNNFKEVTVVNVDDDPYGRGHLIQGDGTLTYNTGLSEVVGIKNMAKPKFVRDFQIINIEYLDNGVVEVNVNVESTYVKDWSITFMGR